MSLLNTNYRLDSDQHGLAIITVTGRCTHDSAAAIEAGVTARYEMVTLPHVAGAVMKVLDGTSPALRAITVTTTGRTYQCVKVYARVNPLSPVQTSGAYSGKAICSYEIRYQQVGGIA